MPRKSGNRKSTPIRAVFVRAVNQAAEHVQVYDNEEERCACGVHIADNPAAGHVAHDVLYCGKGSRQVIGIQVAVRFVVHGQEDTADDLNHEDEQSQRAEVVPEVEVFRRVVLSQMLIPHFRQGKRASVQSNNAFALLLVWFAIIIVPYF